MLKKLIFTMLIAIGISPMASAQNALNASQAIIVKGLKAHERGNYMEAVDFYKTVSANDTNALLALYEMAFSYSKDSAKYNESLETISKAEQYPMNEYKIVLQELRGNVLDNQKKYVEAYQMYDSLIAKYPTYHQPLYEKGISYYNRKKYEEATECFQKSLLLNPYHTKSHYYLGIAYLKQGRLTEAYMAIQATLLTTSKGSEFSAAVNSLEYINAMSDSIINYHKNKNVKFKNEMFDDIDDLLISKIALSKDFQVKTEIDYSLTRNLQVILEKVKFVDDEKNFANQFYVPLYQDVFKQDLFDPFVVLLYSEYGIKEVDKYAKKIKGDLKEVKKLVYDYLNKITGTQELDFAKRNKMEKQFHLIRSENIFVHGKSKKNEKEEDIFVGNVKLYRNQILLGEGSYNNDGKREGVWKYYYSHGPIKSEEKYEDDRMVAIKKFTRNGTPNSEIKYDEKDIVSEEINYYWNGMMMNKSVVLEKNKIDYSTYHKNGNKEAQYIIYKKEVEDGEYELKNDNGTINRKVAIYKGKTDGDLKVFNDKNIEISSGNFVKGKREGDFVEHYNNGNLKEKFTYENDVRVGEYTLYNSRGIISEKGNYEKGRLMDTLIQYDARGNVKCKNTYEKGLMMTSTFIDSNMMQYNSKRVRRIRNATGAGWLYSDYMLNEDGLMNGMVNIYYANGSKQEERSYKAGVLQNELKKYYANGQVSEVYKYKEGKLNGPYTKYNKFGKTIVTGQYVDDEQEGYWLTYNNKEVKIEDRFFIKGKLNGPRYYFESDGKLRFIDWYRLDLLCGASNCDTNGKILQTSFYNNADMTIVAYDFANRKKYDRERKNGVDNGAATRYFPDGKIQEKSMNVNGDFEGKYVSYNINGTIAMEGEYKHDKKVGKWITNNIVGGKISEIEYDDNGNQLTYFEYLNDELRISEEIMDGEICGKKTVYGDAKKVAYILIYDRGDLAAYTYEGKDGNLLPEIKIVGGTAKIDAYYSNGTKSASLNFNNGYSDGAQTTYFSNGKIAEERTIKNLEYTGVRRKYASNGQLVYEANLIDGNINGEEKFYASNGELLANINYYNDEKHGKAVVKKKDGAQMIECMYRYDVLVSVK